MCWWDHWYILPQDTENMWSVWIYLSRAEFIWCHYIWYQQQNIGPWGPELIWQMATKYKMNRHNWPDIYVCVFVYVCMCAYVCLCACVCISMCWCLCRCVCMCLCICAYVYLLHAKYKICIFGIHACHKKCKMWKWYYICVHVCLCVSICLCVSVLCVWCAKYKISIFGMNVG